MINKDVLVERLQAYLQRYGYQSMSDSSDQLNHRLLDVDECDALATYAQDGDSKCQELLIIYCGRLVHSIAIDPSVSDTIVEYTDLTQCGYIGAVSYTHLTLPTTPYV